MADPVLKVINNEKPAAPSSQKLLSLGPVFILLFALLIVASASYYWFVYLEKYVTTDDAYIEADFFPVSTKLAGSVKEVYAREGQIVKKGEVLLQLDESDFLFEKSYKQLKIEKAQLDFKRAETLHETRAISDFDFENAQAALKAAEVDLQGTEIKINYTKVLSPSDGIVAKRSVQIGQLVQPGLSLFIIVDDSDQWVRANFKETQIRNLRVGQKVDIKVDGYPGHPVGGSVEAIFPSSGAKLSILPAENSTGNFTRIVQRIPVKISIDKAKASDFAIKPGMSVEVSVDVTPANESKSH